MEIYSYKILSVDNIAQTMVVEYTPTDTSLSKTTLNINVPNSTILDITQYINEYAPQEQWEKQKSPINFSAQLGESVAVDPTTYMSSEPVDESSLTFDPTIKMWKKDIFNISKCALLNERQVKFSTYFLNQSAGWILTEGSIGIDNTEPNLVGIVYTSSVGFIPSHKEVPLYITAIGDAVWYCITSIQPEKINVIEQDVNSSITLQPGTYILVLSGSLSYAGITYNADTCIDAQLNECILTGQGKVLLITEI
jgi:hypothetical protein